MKRNHGWVPDYLAENVTIGAGRIGFDWKTPVGTVEIEAPLSGWVNVYNLLAAFMCCACTGPYARENCCCGCGIAAGAGAV